MRQALIRLNEIAFSVKKFDLKDTIVIAGTPRSGTTWLAEVLGKTNEYATVFEPLHPVWFPEATQSGFQARTYITPGKSWFAGESYMEKVLSGKIVSTRFQGMGNIKKVILSRRLIVKFIRCNRLLPWLSEKFNVGHIILMVRHPCAVVVSQITSGYYGYNDLSNRCDICPKKGKILSEAEEVDCVDEDIIKKIEKIETPEEVLATVWCLDNYVPLNFLPKERWSLVPYEKLMMDKIACMQQIIDVSGIRRPMKNIEELNKPSKVASSDLKTDATQQLSKWKKSLSKSQIRNILDVVSALELDFYGESLTPDYSRLAKWGSIV